MKRISLELAIALCGLALLFSVARAQQKTSNPPASASKASQAKDQSSGSVVERTKDDRKKDDAPDVLVPAGTQIRVEISTAPDNKLEARVSFPVRVDSATPIPALSKATVRIVGRGTVQDPSTGSFKGADFVELTAVTVGQITYKVQADSAALTYPELFSSCASPFCGNA